MADLKKILKISGIATGLAALVFGGITLTSNFQKSKKIIIQEREFVNVDLSEKRKKELYNSIVNYNHEFFNGTKDREGYVDFMDNGSLWKGYSNEIKRNIDYYAEQNNNERGRGREIIVNGYVDLQKICLDLAVSRLDSEITEQDIDEQAERCVVHMKNIVKVTPIDYEHPAVKEGYKSFVRQRAGWYKEIINANLKNSRIDEFEKQNRGGGFIFREIIKDRYSQKEFRKKLEDYENAKILLYRGFGNSLENYKGWDAFFVKLFGPNIADKTRERSREMHMKEVGRIYGSENSKKNN